MNYLRRYRKQISLAMLIVAGIMALDVIYQVQMHVRWRLWLNQVLTTEHASTQPSAAPGTNQPPGMVEVNASLKRRNIFMEPPPSGHGITLTGVMGKMAIFNNRGGQTFAVEEGKSANGVTVKSITGYEVAIECSGQCETMKLFNQAAGPAINTPMPSPMARPVPVTLPAQVKGRSISMGMKVTTCPSASTQNTAKKQCLLNRNTQPCTTAP
jgi:hypothetical protein